MRLFFCLIGVASADALLVRRAALGSGFAAAAGIQASSFFLPRPAAASDKGAARYASGYEQPKTKEELFGEAQDQVFTPLAKALLAKDGPGLAQLYSADATYIDSSIKPFEIVKGASGIGPYVAARVADGPAVLKLTRCNGEFTISEGTTRILHTQFTITSSGGLSTGYCRLIATDGNSGWKIDREIYPLDNPKAYSMLQPKRDIFGNVYMQLEL
jgi:hypothetical protein